MPIEIKELHIRIAVNTPPGQQSSPSGKSNASGDRSKGGSNGEDKDAMVAECVEQVMQILQNKNER